MSDQEKAAMLLARASRVMSGAERDLLEVTADLHEFDSLTKEQSEAFTRLCTEFAAYLA